MSMTQSRKRKAAYKSKNSKRPVVPAATKKYVQRLLPKVETKELRVHNNEVALNTLTQGYTESGPILTQGTAKSNRLGTEVSAVGLDIRGVLSNNSTSESIVRMLVLSSKNNTDPSLELFQFQTTGTTAGVSSVNGLDAMYYPINTNDFRVHKDTLIRLAGSSTGNGGANVQFIKASVRFPKTRIKFDANLTGLLNQTWTYHVVYIAADANDDTSTGTVAELSSMTRFYYQDA